MFQVQLGKNRAGLTIGQTRLGKVPRGMRKIGAYEEQICAKRDTQYDGNVTLIILPRNIAKCLQDP